MKFYIKLNDDVNSLSGPSSHYASGALTQSGENSDFWNRPNFVWRCVSIEYTSVIFLPGLIRIQQLVQRLTQISISSFLNGKLNVQGCFHLGNQSTPTADSGLETFGSETISVHV
jgi:hypothetical protein